MPIDYQIDHARRLVIARGRGTVTTEDVFGYQREVWSRPDVSGYDELVDFTQVKEIPGPVPGHRVRQLAAESAATDPPRGSRFAIVAPGPLAFGLGRMYQTYRELEPRSTKQVGVFHTLHEALIFLGVEGLPPASPAEGA